MSNIYLDPLSKPTLPCPEKGNKKIEKSPEKIQKIYSYCFTHSLHAQFNDHYNLSSKISASLVVPHPQYCSFSQPSFSDTCEKCLEMIEETAKNTIDSFNFDGSTAYNQLVQLIKKKAGPIDSWTMKIKNEKGGSTCVGLSLAILEAIKNKHQITGTLAIEQNPFGKFDHAGVIIHCSNGLVFIDSWSTQRTRMFAIPFGLSKPYLDFSLQAEPKGSQPCLKITDSSLKTYQYYTNIVNGEDIVLKQYTLNYVEKNITSVVYKNKHPISDIVKLIKINLKNKLVYFEDRVKNETNTIPFKTFLDPNKKKNLENSTKKFIKSVCFNRLHDIIKNQDILTKILRTSLEKK